MTQEEKFKIWDATKPSIAEVGIYLNRLRGKQPDCKTSLPLVYYKSHKRFVRKCYLPDNKRHLYGILLNDSLMLSLKAITRRNIDSVMAYAEKEIAKGAWDAKKLSTTEAKINLWVMDHCSAVFAAMAAYDDDVEILQQHRNEVQQTFEVLRTHGVKVPTIDWDCLAYINEGENYCQDSRRKYDIREYLNTKGDLLILHDPIPDQD